MKRNRENFKSILFVSIIGIYLIIYVFIYLKILHIGYITEKVREEYETLNLINKNYNIQLTKLLSPENLEKLAREKNINLKIPESCCFLEIKEENEKNTGKNEVLEAGTK